MNYHDGSPVALGDVVSVPIPSGEGKARVVMLGDTNEHLEIDQSFVDWVNKDRVLETDSIVIEWIGENPLSHNNPQYAPVGNFMFTPLDQFVSKHS
ncbi:MAG: hypothetical protein HC904_12750 [Blastochloris sp.]|nr:hypothetical protein [Blastochloris sp.]